MTVIAREISYEATVAATLSSDILTVTAGFHTITSESSTSDDLATITLGAVGYTPATFLLLIMAAAGHTITVKHNTGNIKLNASDDFTLSGDRRLFLFYDGTDWGDIGTGGAGVVAGEADKVVLAARKGSAGTIAKMVPVYISGPGAADYVDVEGADADDPAKMPAIAIADESVTDAATVNIPMLGHAEGFDTTSFSVGDELFVSTAGTLTATKPTGVAAQVQKVGVVTRVDATDGQIVLFGAGRTNDVPNELERNLSVGTYSLTDTNTNELIKFLVAGSAINEITVGNAAASSGPSLAATGGDTDIDLVLTPKGTGIVTGVNPVGIIYVDGGSTSQTGIGTSLVKFTGFANDGISAGVTTDSANDKLTVTKPGNYTIIFTIGFTGTNNATFHFYIYVNGVQSAYGMNREITSADTPASLTIIGELAVGAGQDIEIYVKADAASKEVTANQAQLHAKLSS